MTQNFEYFECAETVIKAIEKMSYENPYIMIENNAFSSLLNLIEFCHLSLRKIALKACVNMTNCINNQEFIRKFIMPSIPNLSNLARYIGESELERVILDLSVQCIYNIILAIKNYNLNNNMTEFYKVISEHGILENLYDIFLRYLKIEKDSIYDDDSLLKRKSSFSGFSNVGMNSTTGQGSNTNSFINLETFKNIIKIFEYFCTLNPNIANGILNMRILNVINYILVKELGLIGSSSSYSYKKSQSLEKKKDEENLGYKSSASGLSVSVPQEKTRVGSNSQGYFIEIFNLLISLFPNKNSKGAMDRLLSPDNKNFFTYFSEKILSLIINNIVNIPSSNLMVQIFKLLEMYINSSPEEYIYKYVDSVKFSNIANKMLDSKDSSYIMQVFSAVEIIMNKIPTHFIVSFIREGVIDTIKNLITINEASIYIPNDPQAFMKDFTNFTENIADNFALEDDEENDEEIELLEQEENFINKEKLEALKVISKNAKIKDNNFKDNIKIEPLNAKKDEKAYNVIKINSTKVNKAISSKFNKSSNTEDKNISNDYEKTYFKEDNNLSSQNDFVITTDNYKIGNNNSFAANIFSKENQINIMTTNLEKSISNNKNNNLTSVTKIDNIKKDSKIDIDITSNINNQNLNSNQSVASSTEPISINNHLKTRKKSNVSSGISNIIHSKAQLLTETYFNEENIDNLLKKANIKNNPRDIFKKLSNLRDILKNKTDYEEDLVLKSIIDCLFSEDVNESPTFYEIEKSEVILYFTKFLDENFLKNWENSNDSDSKIPGTLSDKYNFLIVDKIQSILRAINYDLNKIKAFLLSLQNCISSMNCFKLYIYDISNYRNYSPAMFLANMKNTSQRLRVKFNYCFDNTILKDTEFKNIPSLTNIMEINSKNENLQINDKLKLINSNFNANLESFLKDENELKAIKEIHEYFQNNIKAHSINLELYDNIGFLKDYFLKLKSSKDNLAGNTTGTFDNVYGHSASSNNIDFFDDIISNIANRKGSEDEFNLTEKLLQRIMDRKKSFEQINNNITNNTGAKKIDTNPKEEINNINNNIKNTSNDVNSNFLNNNLEKFEAQSRERKNSDLINTFSASFNTNSNANNNFNKILDHSKILDEKLEFIYFAIINGQKFFIKDNLNLIDFFREIKNKVKKADYTNFANDVQIQFSIYIREKNSIRALEDSNEYFMDNNLLYRIDDEKLNPAWNFSNITNNLDAMEKIKYFYLHKDNKVNPYTHALNSKKKSSKTNKMNTNNNTPINLDELDNFKIENYSISDTLEKVLFEKYYFENIINNPALYCIKRASPFVFLISLFELAINNYKNVFKIENKDDDIGLRAETSNELLGNDVLENLKVTSLIFKQTRDPYAVSNMCVPSWCKDLIHNFTYLSGFNSRYLLFKITSFDLKRAISNLYIYLKNYLGENVVDDKNLSTFKRHKYKIDRSKVITDATNLMKDFSGYSVIYLKLKLIIYDLIYYFFIINDFFEAFQN